MDLGFGVFFHQRVMNNKAKVMKHGDFTGVSSCRLVQNLEGMPLAILTEKIMINNEMVGVAYFQKTNLLQCYSSSFFSCQNDRHTLYALQGPLQQEIQPAEFGLLGPVWRPGTTIPCRKISPWANGLQWFISCP